MALIGSITNYGSLRGEVNGYGNSLTGEITDAVTLGGEVVGMRGLKGDKGDTGDTGATGADGQDGYSPSASVEKVGNIATITITDEDGTTTASISDGADGQDGADGEDGFSPSASVSKVDNVATITITDKDGTTTASISDGDINVQSDWNEADTTADDYIKNKPAIPSATSTTPKMDGTASVGSETTWAKGDHVHPTDTSRAASSHTHTKSDVTDFPSLATVATSGSYTDLSSKPDIHNVPSGGTSGQVLSKGSNDDYDLAWTTASGGAEIAYCTCTDSASTVAKTATVVSGSITLKSGALVAVKFDYQNTAASPTLNVGNTGAKSIKRYGTTAVGQNVNESWNAGSVVLLVYDGTNWIVTDFLNTTYSGGTANGIITGTDNLNYVWTPKQIHDGIDGMATATPTASKNSKFDASAHMNSTDMTTGADSELEDFIDGLNVGGGDRTSSTLTVSSGWTASQNWCKRSAYTVEFYIEVTGGTLSSGWNTIATLPQDYIPPSYYDFVAVENTNDTSVHGKVTATGAVQVYKASNVTNALRIHGMHMVF